MRDRRKEFEALDAEIVTIGLGLPGMAADFKKDRDIPFLVLTDRTKETYRMLGLGRASLMELVGPQVWWRFTKGMLTGHGVAKPQQDPYQLGGAVVIEKGGSVKHVHRAKDAADNLPVNDLLAALSR